MNCIVLDVGKTNVKAAVVNSDGKLLEIQTTATPTQQCQDYRAIDVDRIFAWFLDCLSQYSKQWQINKIIPVAHGAACVLIDENGELAFPMLDYEQAVPEKISAEYERARPEYSKSLSPSLPSGLNLGRQLYWLSKAWPETFKNVKHILLYPQYWAWRLSGVLSSEITSLGVHTDLWCFPQQDFSSLVKKENWEGLFPEMQHAWASIGKLRDDLAQQSGITNACEVYCGVHDSNSALFPFIANAMDRQTEFALLSTGTWFIAMSPNAATDQLDANRDCLANIDVFGKPVACSRFMGGREYEILLGDYQRVDVDEAAICEVIQAQQYALPSFTTAGGPFPDFSAAICPDQNRTEVEQNAIGVLYLALMADVCLSLVSAQGDLIIEGPLTSNRSFCRLLAALRRPGSVYISEQQYGVTQGAAALAYWPETKPKLAGLAAIEPMLMDEMSAYKQFWQQALTQQSSKQPAGV